MTDITRRAGLIAAIALVVATACGRNGTGSSAIDDGLRSDLEQAGASGLELAPKAGRQVVVSAIEGGPRSAPTPAPHRSQRPVQRTSQSVTTAQRAPAPTPVRRQVEAEPTAPSPTPAPQPQAQQRQPGVYSTEADVFRQMPWIRP